MKFPKYNDDLTFYSTEDINSCLHPMVTEPMVTVYKNAVIDTVILMTKKKIYKNRQKGKVTNITEIKYELSVQLQYEQYYAEIERKLPIFEQKWLALIQMLG